jgi:hypothetical protein
MTTTTTTTATQQQDSGMMPVPITPPEQRPPAPPPAPKLAFVRYDFAHNKNQTTPSQTTTTTSRMHWWWPAIVYSSYGQAMDERHETLSMATQNRFLRSMWENRCARRARLIAGLDPQPDDTSNKTMNVAQLLGYDDLWVEFDATQQKKMLAYVLEALEQREKLPSKFHKAYDLAFEQLKLLLTFDPSDRSNDGSMTIPMSIDDILSSGICHHPDATTTTQPRTLTTPAADDTHQQQQSEPPPSSSSSSALIVSSHKKRSAPVKVRGKRRQVQVPCLTASQRAQQSSDNFYVFHALWSRLREDGWTSRKATRKQLHDWFYIRPVQGGNNNDKNAVKEVVKNGTMGVDFFTSTDQVIEWAKRMDYRRLVGDMSSEEDDESASDD